MAVKRLYITNKAEAIRLFEAGLLRYEDTFTGMARGTDEIESRLYNPHHSTYEVLLAWSTELHYYRPHILVEEEEEDA